VNFEEKDRFSRYYPNIQRIIWGHY